VSLVLPACGDDKGSEETEVPLIEIPTGDKADDLNEPIDTMSCPEPGRLFRQPSAWTVMHFAAADNNLEDVIVDDINEMEMGHRGSNNVNVIVQLDKYQEDGIWRYRVEPDSDMNKLNSRLIGYSAEEYDSGDWRTLAWFGKWAVTCYPADNYVLIIGGHGGGWSVSPDGRAGQKPSLRERAQHKRAKRQGESLRMIAPDATNGSEIYVNQLARAMKVIQAATVRTNDPEYVNRLVAYGSDACLMETIEVAYELRNSVTYLLGSEETEPGEGWPYSTIVRGLTERPYYYATRHHELVSLVVEKYGTSYGPGGVVGQTGWITFAGVDTSGLIKARNRIDSVAALLTELIDEDDDLAGLVFSARWDSYEFGDGYVDLGQFMAKLRATLIEAGKMPDSGQHWDGDERFRDLRKAIDGLLNDVWPDLVVANLQTDTYPEGPGSGRLRQGSLLDRQQLGRASEQAGLRRRRLLRRGLRLRRCRLDPGRLRFQPVRRLRSLRQLAVRLRLGRGRVLRGRVGGHGNQRQLTGRLRRLPVCRAGR
jgi:hypothetical protein